MSRSIWRWLNFSSSCNADNAAVARVKSEPEKSPHSRQTSLPGLALSEAAVCCVGGEGDCGAGAGAGGGAGAAARAGAACEVLAEEACGAGSKRIMSLFSSGCGCTPCPPQPNQSTPPRCITANKITFASNNIQNNFLIARCIP